MGQLVPPQPAPDGPTPLSGGAVGRLGGGQFRVAPYAESLGFVTLSGDGRKLLYLAAKIPDPRLVVRQFPDGADIRAFEIPAHHLLSSVALTPDGSSFVATQRQAETVVTDLKTGVRELVEFPNAHLSEWHGIQFSADGRRMTAGGLFGGDAGRVVVWDRAAKKLQLHAIPVHLTQLGVRLSADGKTAVSGGALIRPPAAPRLTNVLQVWDVDGDKERVRIESDHPVGGFDVSPDGTRLAAVTHPGLLLFDATRGKLIRVIDGNAVPYSNITFSPDGKQVAAIAPDGAAVVWEIETGKRLSTTAAPARLRPTIRYTGPDRGVVLALNGTLIQAWEFPSAKLLTPTGPHAHPLTAVAISADGKRVFSGDQSGLLAEWEPTRPADAKLTPVRVQRTDGDGRTTGPLTISPGGVYLALHLTSDRTSDQILDRATGRVVYATSRYRHTGAMRGVFSPDGSRVFFPQGSNQVSGKTMPPGVIEVATGKDLATLPRDVDVEAAAFSPDGRRLATVRQADEQDSQGPRVVTVWDATTGRKIGEATAPNRGARAVVAATNSGSAVLGFGTQLLALNVPGGVVGDTLDKLSGRQGGEIRAIVFSHDGKLLAAGLPTDEVGGYGVRVYEWPSGRRLHEFRGHGGRVTALAFSPDGKLLAAGSEDTSVVVWDMAAVGKR